LKLASRGSFAGTAGLCTVRLEVASAGHVKRATVLVDTLVATRMNERAPTRAMRAILSALLKARFPPRRGASVVVAPVLVARGAARVVSRVRDS
jgi:hypothetical protein